MAKTMVAVLAVSLFSVAALAAVAAETPSAAGFWVTADREGVVEIMPCDSGLCGRLVGLRHNHPPGEVPRDIHNSDASKRTDPLCGLMMMGSFKPVAGNPSKWEDGWAYDPDSGKTYSGQFELAGADTLKLRGYIGIPLLGRTETWTREGGEPHNRCTVPTAG